MSIRDDAAQALHALGCSDADIPELVDAALAPVAKHLRDRAESYSRDAVAVALELDAGDSGVAAMAYRTIADELRKVAREVEG